MDFRMVSEKGIAVIFVPAEVCCSSWQGLMVVTYLF